MIAPYCQRLMTEALNLALLITDRIEVTADSGQSIESAFLCDT